MTKGKLDLGQGEQSFYGEFDGYRRTWVLVMIIRERRHLHSEDVKKC